MLDVLIRNGQIVDGTGSPPFRADLGITGDRIVAIGRLDSSAGKVVDATGRLVMPGFVDAHSHADSRVLDDDVQHALLRQGVTTVITGQDGVSYAPGSAEATTWAGKYFGGINGRARPEWTNGLTVSEYRAALTGTTRVNSAHLLPHGTMRYDVAGLDPTLSDDARKRLLHAVEQGLSDGACGLSSGLHYVPGLYADADEFTDIGHILSAAGRPYVTHMRGYEAEAWIGMAEVTEIGRRSGAAVHVSHFHGPSNMLLLLVEQARAEGVDITFDSYPYLRGFTLLTNPTLPNDLLSLGPATVLAQLARPDVADRLCSEWFPKVDDVFDRASIASAPADDYRHLEGFTIREAAALKGEEPGRFTIALLLATAGEATAVFSQPPTNTDTDVRTLLRHEAHVGGSDGIYLGGRPHPRAWATFARYLAHHTRDLGDWTWGQASTHLASHPARRFGLLSRGVLRPSAIADVVVVDPVRIQDTATYADPRQLAEGIDDVWVNGVRVLRGGALEGILAGKSLAWGD